MIRPMHILTLALLVLGEVLTGCGSPSEASLGADSPGERVRGIARAVESDDSSAIDRLIVSLDSDDPAERMLSIGALNRLTGQTLGYDFAAPRAEREAAIGRWMEWRRAERAGMIRTGLGEGTEPPEPDTKSDGA